MKFKLLQITFLVTLVFLLAACNGGNEEEAGQAFSEEDFNLTLPSTTGEQVTLVPNEKTLYLYFTGVG